MSQKARLGPPKGPSTQITSAAATLEVHSPELASPQPVSDAEEVCQLAINLARNCGYPVFPVQIADKRPYPGTHGKDDATADPDQIRRLWRQYPDSLIAVRTGFASGICLLDVDAKHDTARAWWRQYQHLLPATRTFRTRGGGLHMVYLHADGVRNIQGKPLEGIDVRGEGGYMVWWFAHGCECLDHRPPVHWPAWLTTYFWPPQPQVPLRPHSAIVVNTAIDGVIRAVREAREGTRNGTLFWAANRLRERGISQGEAETTLLAAAAECGLPAFEVRRTIASAWRHA